MVGQVYVWIFYRYPCRYYNWIFNVGMMKKLLLLVMLAISHIAGAQEEIQSVEGQIGVRKLISNEWKWKKAKPCEVLFTIENNQIKSNDRAKSVYNTYETIKANDKVGIWKATDEKGKQCTVRIEYNNPMSKLEIEYSYTCYRYFFKM